ncbi:putative hydroxypyruvate reductase [Deinococcus caeni]|uniref:Hydroxypyruvate reductase n=1 Tax=Deinococcus caeni TaxID=569127 RepID=A0ABP9UIZ4_9DEIO
MTAPPDLRALLRGAFLHALEAASPARLLEPALRDQPAPDLILAVGKASVPMAGAALNAFPGVPTLVVTPRGPASHAAASHAPTGHAPAGQALPAHAEVLFAPHPVPDAASEHAARRALARLGALRAGGRALVLISGGGSALLSLPRGVTLAQKQALTRDLLGSGADIHEINTVRRHLSGVKGGQLAAATRAHVHSLILSDVVGDVPAVIASGPTVPDPTTHADAVAVLDRHGLPAPEARAHLRSGAPDTPGDLPNATWQIIGSNRTFLEAARAFIEARGLRTVILGDTFTGEARSLAAFHASVLHSIRTHGTPLTPPVAVLSGGEATVTLTPGAGRGGRNLEFALALLTELGETGPGLRGLHALSAGTDGQDGSSPAAGAFLTPDSLTRAGHLGLDPHEFLRRHDSHTFFEALGDTLHTGLTGHNLNDFRAVVLT